MHLHFVLKRKRFVKRITKYNMLSFLKKNFFFSEKHCYSNGEDGANSHGIGCVKAGTNEAKQMDCTAALFLSGPVLFVSCNAM